MDYSKREGLKSYECLSLFSGIGGIDLGSQQAGFDIVWANEYDANTAKTYRKNFGKEHLVEGDITKIDITDMSDFDILAAGFPCQPFSSAGMQEGYLRRCSFL